MAASGIYGQGLTPSFPTKEYVYLGSQVIAIENSPLKDVSNAGFESGSLSSWPLNFNGSVASVTNTVSHSGSYSLKMTGPAGSGIAQDITGMVAGQQYIASAWVNVSAGATAYFYLDDSVSSGTTVFALDGQTNGWQYTALPFTADSTGKVRIHLWFASGTGTIYWDDISVTPAVILTNYGFETGGLNPWSPFPQGTNATISNAAHSGSHSMTISTSGAVVQGVPNLSPGRQYVVSAWAWVSSGNTAQLLVNDTVSWSTSLMANQGVTNSTWQFVSLPFTTDSSGAMNVHLFSLGNGIIYWDDASVVPAITVGNYGFESGSLSSWPGTYGGTNASVTSAVAHTGSYSLQMSGPGFSGIYQDIAELVIGQQYVVSAWVNVSGGAIANLYLDDTVSQGTTQMATQGQTNGWQYISLPFTVDSTGKIRIHLWFGSGSGTIYWDDVSVVP